MEIKILRASRAADLEVEMARAMDDGYWVHMETFRIDFNGGFYVMASRTKRGSD